MLNLSTELQLGADRFYFRTAQHLRPVGVRIGDVRADLRRVGDDSWDIGRYKQLHDDDWFVLLQANDGRTMTLFFNEESLVAFCHDSGISADQS